MLEQITLNGLLQDLSVTLQTLLVAASEDGSESQYTLQQLREALSSLNVMEQIVSNYTDYYPSLSICLIR